MSNLGVRPMASCQLHATWAMYSTGAGLNADFYNHVDALADIGFECVRMDLSWSESQPTAGTLPTASTQVIQRVTAALNYLSSKGMKGFITPWRAPQWAHPAVSDVNTFPDSGHMVAYQTWVTRIADLFGGHPALLALEVWNEPDLDAMSGAGADNYAAYAPILMAAYDGVKASTFPDTKVCVGGPVAADWHYLEGVVNAIEAANGGLNNKYDILAFHPYQGNWKHRFDSYDYSGVSRDAAGAWTQFRSAGGIKGVTWTGSSYVADANSPNSIMGLRKRHSDTRPMWATEWGTSRAIDSATVAAQRSVTTDNVGSGQTYATVDAKWADYYVQAFTWLQNQVADVTLLNCYTAYRPTSPSTGGSLSTDGMRLLNLDGSLTAAATALKTYFAANPTHRDPFGDTAPASNAPVFRVANTTTNDSVSATTTGSLAGISDGDFMIAEFVSSDTVTGAALTSVPAGWTVVRAHTSNGSSMSTWWGYRFKQSGDAAPAWVLAAARDTQVLIYAASGVDPNNPYDMIQLAARPSTTSVATTDAPAATSTGSNRLVVRMYGEKSSTATTVTDPAGNTRRAAAFGAGASTTSAYAADAAQANAGSTGAATVTYNASSPNGIGATFVLAPVATVVSGADLLATSDMAADGTRIVLGSAALSAASSLTASGSVTSAAGGMSAISNLVAGGVKTAAGSIAFGGLSSMTVDGLVTRPIPATPDTERPGRIFVAGMARVYLGPVGTAAPTDPGAAFDTAFKEVGLFTQDSLKFTITATFEQVASHQSDYPDIDIETGRDEVLAVDLQEWSADSFRAVHGGGQVTESSAGIWTFVPPQLGTARQPVMCVVRCTDGGRNYALVIPKCVVLDGIEHGLGRGQESILPLRLTVRQPAGGFPYWWITDDDESWRPIVPVSFLSFPGAAVFPSDALFPQTP